MNLSNFEKEINPIILQRGRDYFKDGCVAELEAITRDSYRALVEGSEDYTVNLVLGADGAIRGTDCDCPYDMGPYCKHQAAVFFALRKLLTAAQPEGKRKKGTAPEPEPLVGKYRRILIAQSQAELVEFLTELALADPLIGDKLEYRFDRADPAAEIKQSAALIRGYIRKQSDRSGFVSYRNTGPAVRGAEIVLENAAGAAAKGDTLRAAWLYRCILREMLPLLQTADDSDGIIGDMIESAVNGLAELAAAELPAETAEQLFKEIIAESGAKHHQGWDWGMQLLDICAELALSPGQRRALEKRLEPFFSGPDTDHNRYDRENASEIRRRLIEKFEGKEKAAAYLDANLSFPSFREAAIKKALEAREFAKAEALARQGEERDHSLPGLVNRWREYRYQIYRKSGELGKAREVALGFIRDGSLDYYKLLRESYDPEQWRRIYPGVMPELNKGRGFWSGSYSAALIMEGEFAQLLEYIQASPHLIITYAKQLLPAYQNEVFAIFEKHILQEAERANNRDSYRRVAGIIRQLIKLGGDGPARGIIEQLIKLYPKRPAFHDELGGIKIVKVKD